MFDGIALMVLHSWFVEGLIPEDRILEMFCGLSHRGLGGFDAEDDEGL